MYHWHVVGLGCYTTAHPVPLTCTLACRGSGLLYHCTRPGTRLISWLQYHYFLLPSVFYPIYQRRDHHSYELPCSLQRQQRPPFTRHTRPASQHSAAYLHLHFLVPQRRTAVWLVAYCHHQTHGSTVEASHTLCTLVPASAVRAAGKSTLFAVLAL